MTGWKLVDSEGEEYKAWHLAVKAWKRDPSLTFAEHGFNMGGHVEQDATDEVIRRAGLDVDWLDWLRRCDDVSVVRVDNGWANDNWAVEASTGDARTGGGTYVANCDKRWQAELVRDGLRALIEKDARDAVQHADCVRCAEEAAENMEGLASFKMILCPNCDDKRCPKALDHNNECTRNLGQIL